jgi:hypothetical protein
MKKTTTTWMMAALLTLGATVGWAQDGAPPLETIKGEVLEVLDVPNYTYIRLKTASSEVWAAVSSAKLAVGAPITLENAVLMDDFQSQALKRTFPQIYFANLPVVPLSEAEVKAAIDSAHAAAAKAKQTEHSPITKASGAEGRTVVEIITSTPNFKDTAVAVRGRVVKYSAGIMGKNWLHLRDGSGSEADATNDLVVTTLEPADMGELLLVKGTVRKDQDFGAGYAYKVMIENATLER